MTSPSDDDVIVTASNRLGRKVPNLVVRGMDEREILGHAPAMTCDRVHWDTVDDFDAHALVDELGMTAYTRQWSDGQHRVWVAEGQGYEARERIREWCAAHDVEAVNVRVEAKVPFRDLDQVPAPLVPELISAALDWLYPRSHAIRAKVVADLELVDAEDVRSMMYLFISDHLDRYDADREGRNGTLNLLAFLIGKLRTWPQDLTRTAFGRNVVSDRIALHRAVDGVAAVEHRGATEAERADALRTTVTDLRKREQAIATLSSLRNYQSLIAGAPDEGVLDTVQVASDEDVEERRDPARPQRPADPRDHGGGQRPRVVRQAGAGSPSLGRCVPVFLGGPQPARGGP